MGAASSKSELAQAAVVDEKQSVRDVAASLAALRISTPASADGALSPSNIKDWESRVAASPRLELTRTVLNHTDVRSALLSRKAIVDDVHVFNTEVKFKTGPVTSQKSSGRCWLFATTNVLRYNIMKKFNLDDFQLSQVCHVLLSVVGTLHL